MDQTPSLTLAQNISNTEPDLLFKNAVIFYNLLCDIREKGGSFEEREEHSILDAD
jgi:hypothetical protein